MLRKTVLAVAVICGLALSAQGVSAQSDYAVHDMFLTESAATLEQGATDVEVGLQYKWATGGRGFYDNHYSRMRRPRYELWDWTVDITHGLTGNQDVFVSLGYSSIKDRAGRPPLSAWTYSDDGSRGFDDVTVGTKLRFHEDAQMNVAWIPSLSIPCGRNSRSGRIGPGNSYWGLDNTVAASGRMDDLIWNADVGFMLPFGEGRHHYSTLMGAERRGLRGVLEANAGVGFQAMPELQPIVELSYGREWVSGGGSSVFVAGTVGTKIMVDDNVRVKLGYQHPLTGRNASRSKSLLASVGFEF